MLAFFAATVFSTPVIALLIAALVVIAAGVVLAVLYHHTLRKLRQAAERFAAGDLSRKVEIPGFVPLGDLAKSLNRMAEQIQERYQAVVQQRLEMEAVLSSMVEGVVVVDPEQRVISVNAAAGRLLGVEPAEVTGQPIQQVTRNMELHRLVTEALQSDRAVQDDLAVEASASHGPAECYLQVQSAPLRDALERRIGAVIVLHDVSELVRLEGVRRDFVANVSHEIKTPVTAIKGFAETLLETPDHSPEDAERFLKVIARQADRLHAIVTDLLTLSSIERDAQERRLELQQAKVAQVLEAAAESCQFKAEARNIRLSLECDPELTAAIEAALIEQALINLIDNAIKYSPDGTTIHLAAGVHDGELVVSVRDEGSGIDAKHLPRLFERFYRTDKARSREMGGTGLGLAIVKHVAHIHDGRVDVQSEVGRGSTFSLHLPHRLGGTVEPVTSHATRGRSSTT